ncbi:MAG: hypothetical protein IJS45_04180 [Clostridia bacterium]|nr:hypothetical protein [Clostridia bacterium]
MKKSFLYRLIMFAGRIICPRSRVVYETVPDECPGIFVCNHSAIRGPVMMTLYFDRPHKPWVITYALDKEKTPDFAFHDFFVGEGRRHKRFWRFISKIVGKVLPQVLNEAGAIPVYHDSRALRTVRESIDALNNGCDLVIFAESPVKYSEYVNELQTGFVDVGALYYKRTGKLLKYYPVYVEKKNRKISVGSPVVYDPSLGIADQRSAVAEYLKTGIDRLAREMKPHKPVPFLPQRWYDVYGRYEKDFDAYWRSFEGDGPISGGK